MSVHTKKIFPAFSRATFTPGKFATVGSEKPNSEESRKKKNEQMLYIISEHDGCKKLEKGDEVMATPLYSCCLIVMRMQNGDVYAEHCGASNIDTLSEKFLQSGPIAEAIMVTSKESKEQIEQAHKLQLKKSVSDTKLFYYASDIDNGCTPIVKVNQGNGTLELVSKDEYHLVSD